ncbi:MAG TPA: alpha/beta hydrolase [Ramlibacter sp.]|jgi:aminoacrylate hydrolase|nr:alpha/beta hydrolase [Ramlibacter sp.]
MFLKTADADFFVTSFGPGPRTFVAHGGWVGSGELWLQPFETLSRRWRTVTYDHRGTGATINRAEKITFDLLVDDLFRVLDALKIDSCVLAGESSGALVVLEAALRQPGRFEGLVLVDGRASASNTAGAARFIEGCRTDFPATMEAFVRACVTERDAQAELRWGKQIVMRSSGPEAIQLMEAMWTARVDERLGEIRQPTLLLHGRNDLITPAAMSEDMARRIPNAKLHVFEDAGHVPVITRPEQVAHAIETFFA